ncbi:hypothetical protein PLCT1_00675 [Planctomycetaceae bacterium]|nr:hypothetical protein PLCT1_00675 [Planctomycetaceae bacterium]
MPWRTDEGHEVSPLSEPFAVQAHAWLCVRFGEPWRMLDGWIVFGQEQGSRFDLLFNEDRTVQLSARIDLRSEYQSFVEAVCELASKSNCLLFSAEYWAALEPSVSELSGAARRSRAGRFVRDPGGFLKGEANGG